MVPVLDRSNGAFNVRVPRWLSPDPQEALTSFLFRLARFNFYDPPTLLHSLWRERLHKHGLTPDSDQYPIHTASYAILSELTGIPFETLYLLSGHPLASVLTPPYLEIPSLVLPNECQVVCLSSNIYNHLLRPAQAVPYCPLCLAENLSYPLLWLTDLVICPRHWIVLLDACPQCHTSLSIRAVTEGRCPQCDGNLASAETCSVADDSWGRLAQAHLQAWFGWADPATLPDVGLPKVSPRILYALLNGFHRCLRRRVRPQLVHRPASWTTFSMNVIPLSQCVPPMQHYCLTAAAFRALTDWPHGFWNFMDGYRPVQSGEAYCDPKRQLGTLHAVYLEMLWKHPDFHFVQQAFDVYFLEHFAHKIHLQRHKRFHASPRLQAEQPLMDAETACQVLKVSKSTFYMWVGSGTLSLVQRHPVHRVDRQQVLALRDFRQAHISLRQAAGWLKMSVHLTVQLIPLGLLSPQVFHAYSPTIDWFAVTEVRALQQRLQAAFLPCPDAHHFYSLAQVISRFPARHLTHGQVLLAVLEGKLPAYSLPDPRSLVRSLRFDPAHLHCFSQ
jgi:hypothetical protein